MEVPKTTYDWLQQANALQHSALVDATTAVLHEADTELFEAGLGLVPLLKRVAPSTLDVLAGLTEATSAPARLFNWNLLIGLISQLGITVDADAKALIVAGDRPTIAGVLRKLQRLEPQREVRRKKKRVNVDGAILVNNIDEQAQLSQTNSPLEFLILSLSQSVKLTPKQSAGLLTQSGKYLEALVCRGFKGKFFPVLNWYKAVMDDVSHLASLLQRDQTNSLVLTMNSLKTGLLSADNAVYQAACLTITALHWQLPNFEGDLWEWFLSAQVIADLMKTYQRAPDLLSERTVWLLYQFSKDRLVQTFGEMLYDYLPGAGLYFAMCSAVLRHLAEDLEAFDALLSQGVVNHWISQALNECEESGRAEVRLPALFFMCDLWENYPSVIESQESTANSILTEFKKVFREKSKLFKLSALGRVSLLLAQLKPSSTNYLRIWYKTLAFTLTENFRNDTIREFILTNLVGILEFTDSVPIDIILEPTIKQLQNLNVHLNTFDFDFFIACARFPKLDLKLGVLLMDTLGKILVSDLRFARAAEIPFVILAGRFIDSNATQEFITRFLGTSFKMFLTEYYPQGLPYSLDHAVEEGHSRALRNSLFALTEKLLKLGNEPMTETLRELLTLINAEARTINGQSLQGAIALLDVFGRPRRTLEVDYGSGTEKEVSEKRWRPSIGSVPRAVSVIEHIVQQRKMKERHQRSISEQRNVVENRRKEVLRRQIQARRVELGVSSRGYSQTPVPVFSKPRVEANLLFDPEEETEHEQSLLYFVMKRYRRASKALFTKYAKVGRRRDNISKEDFTAAQEKQEQLLEGEVIKMLRDQHLSRDFISTERLKLLFKQLTQKFKVIVLSYEHFLNFLYQVAQHCFSRGSSRDLSHYPSAIALKALFEYFSYSDVIPKALFDDTDPGAADREVVQALNQQLLLNPSMQLPHGFKKVKENFITVTYSLPETVEAPTSFKVALSVLDEIINEQFHFHLLQPFIEVDEVVRAKGLLNRPEVAPEEYRNGVPAHRAAYKVLPLPAYLSLTPGIKLGLSWMAGAYPNDLLLEVGRLTDDLLHSVHSHSSTLISRNPRPAKDIDNSAKLQKVRQVAHHKAQRAKSDNKRMQRKEELRQELARLQAEKAQREAEERMRLKSAEVQQQQKETRQKLLKEREQARKNRQLEEYRKRKDAQKQLQQPYELERKADPEFLKQAKRKLRMLYNTKVELRKKEQEELDLKAQEDSEKKKLLEKALQAKLATVKKQHESEASLKQLFEDAWNNVVVRAIFQQYRNSLLVVFDVYAKQFHASSATTIPSMNLKAFNKFLVQFNIIPSLINAEVMERVYWSLCKTNAPQAGLSFEDFQQSCLRLSIFGNSAIQKDTGNSSQSVPELLADFFDWISLPRDARETREFLKQLDLQHVAVNPRDKKKQKNLLLRQLTNNSQLV